MATFLLVAATALLAIEANASSRINSISSSISSSSSSLSVEGVCVVDDSNGNEAGCSSETSTVSHAVDPHELLPHEQSWPLNRGWDPSLDACDESIAVRPALTIEEVCTQCSPPITATTANHVTAPSRCPVSTRVQGPTPCCVQGITTSISRQQPVCKVHAKTCAAGASRECASDTEVPLSPSRHAAPCASQLWCAAHCSSSNSYSHGRRPSTLGNYMLNYMSPQHVDTLANKTWYLV